MKLQYYIMEDEPANYFSLKGRFYMSREQTQPKLNKIWNNPRAILFSAKKIQTIPQLNIYIDPLKN